MLIEVSEATNSLIASKNEFLFFVANDVKVFNPSKYILLAYISEIVAFIYVTSIFAKFPGSGCSVTSKSSLPVSVE